MNRISLLLGPSKITIAHILYKNKIHDGVFSFGSNYKSSYGEVLYAAFNSEQYFLKNKEILEKIENFQNEDIISIIENIKSEYYGCNSGIDILNSKFPYFKKILLYFYIASCATMQIKINNLGIEFEGKMSIANVVGCIISDINFIPLVVKFIPIEKKIIPKINNYREIVAWENYQINRNIQNIDILHKPKKILYTYGYINETKHLYNQEHIKNRDNNCALYIILLYMGTNIKNIINTTIAEIKLFRNIVFMVASRLLILNQSGFLHGDLHIDNFVYFRGKKNLLERKDIYIKSGKLRIRCYISCIGVFDIIDLGESVLMTESSAISDFIFKCAPDLHKRYNSQITKLCKISPEDIAIAVSLLDLHYFIADWEREVPNANLYSDIIADMKNYIIEEIIRYLDYDTNLTKSACYEGAGLNELNQDDRYILNHKSVFSQEYIGAGFAMFGGIDKILSNADNYPLYKFKESKKSYKLDYKVLPIWRFMQTFYGEESAAISDEDLKNAAGIIK